MKNQLNLVIYSLLMLLCSVVIFAFISHPNVPSFSKYGMNHQANAGLYYLLDTHIDKQEAIQRILKAYPDEIIGYEHESLIFKDSSRFPLTYTYHSDTLSYADDNYYNYALKYPDIIHMLAMHYPKGDTILFCKNCDPGRIRDSGFFAKMYGSTSQAVRASLDTVYWLKGTYGKSKPILISTINRINERLQAVSDKLDKLPHLHPYVKCASTFNWRKIKNTNRMSPHAYGIAIDICVKKSNYHLWDKKRGIEGYHNSIPMEVIKVFESEKFISGAKWTKHYDSMHFEYRPELFN